MCPVLPEKDQTIFRSTSPFHFSCHDNLPCFTQCCRDVNIYLTPYDLLRLRRSLKIGSGELLAKYTRQFLIKAANIPVVQLKMNPDTLYCRFVTDEGCRVYDNRPWACRMYPVDLASNEGEYRMIVGKERCMGLSEPTSWTIEEWLQTQGVTPHFEMDQAFQSVIPGGFMPDTRLEQGLEEVLFLAYDLDRFAEFLKDPEFCAFYEIEPEVLRQAQEDDETLLRLAFRYIRNQMGG